MRRHALPLLRAACLVLFAYLLVRTAWLSDDAYISFRTVRNLVAGDGLRWNLVERVQVFTHPLWLFLVSAAYAVTHDLYYTVIALSVVLSLAAAAVLAYRVAPAAGAGALAVALLASSRSFVDFSTSGLENPLSHLLLVLMIERYLRRDGLFAASLLAGLSAVNRLDSVLVTVPILVAMWGRAPSWRRLGLVALGFAPLLAWEIFSVVYFGFPFPNTAYAKLPPGLDHDGVIERGKHALRGSLDMDPLLRVVLAVGIVVPLRRGARHLLPLSAGILLQLVYLVWVGGDFMAGRFLTVALLLAVASIAVAWPWPRSPACALAVAAAVYGGLAAGPRASLRAGDEYGKLGPALKSNQDAHGIADERAVYYKDTGLLRAGEAWRPPSSRRFTRGQEVKPGEVVSGIAVGFYGWSAPRDATIVDTLALADPLLARMPLLRPKDYRPGHLDRIVPRGYLETRKTGVSQIADPSVARLWERISLITQGPIFAAERWRAIWELNAGATPPDRDR